MPKYHQKIIPSGLQEQLAAARSPDTHPDVLDILIEIPEGVVQIAVAENPSTAAQTLAALVPHNLHSKADQWLATALATNINTPDYALQRLAERIAPLLGSETGSEEFVQIGVKLCCNPSTPHEALELLLKKQKTTAQFREAVAKQTRRADVLQLLAKDRSQAVRAQAIKTLESISEASA